MPGEVDEDIDIIRRDARRGRLTVKTAQADIVRHERAQPIRHVVLLPARVVEKNLVARAVEARIELDGEIRHDMLVKIR